MADYNQGWMNFKLIVIEPNFAWPYANQDVLLRATDPIYLIAKEINARHTKIRNLRFYKDSERTQIIEYDFKKELGVIFGDNGVSDKASAKTFQIYYEFENDVSSPILLYDNPWKSLKHTFWVQK